MGLIPMEAPIIITTITTQIAIVTVILLVSQVVLHIYNLPICSEILQQIVHP